MGEVTHQPTDLGSPSGLLELARSAGPLFSAHQPDGAAVVARLRATLGVLPVPDRVEPETVETWTADGVDGAVLRWDVGLGAPSEG